MVEKKGASQLKLDKDKTTIIVMVSIAAFAVIAALMICRGLWNQNAYLGKVTDKKEDAVEQLRTNQEAVVELTESYNDFISQNPNLLIGDKNGTGERDGPNDALILDALPNKYDFPAVTASVEKLLTGYAINSISGVDDLVAQQAATNTGYTEIPFEVEAQTNYDGFKSIITSFNKSIRPFHMTKLDVLGTNDSLQVTISAKTFYQPERGLQVTQEEVQ